MINRCWKQTFAIVFASSLVGRLTAEHARSLETFCVYTQEIIYLLTRSLASHMYAPSLFFASSATCLKDALFKTSRLRDKQQNTRHTRHHNKSIAGCHKIWTNMKSHSGCAREAVQITKNWLWKGWMTCFQSKFFEVQWEQVEMGSETCL